VSPVPSSSIAEPQIDQSVFEGLFRHALKPTGQFATDLAAIGYDPQRPQRTYPTRVWIEAARVTCRHIFPELAEPEAMLRLGRLYVNGFLDTIVGRLIGVSLSILGPESVIKRIPRWAAMNATGVEVSVTPLDPGVWKATWKDPNALPEFVAGMMQGGAYRAGITIVELAEKRPDGFDLILRFPPKG
jgi:uncharacterized protein (TIGR02265 family)